MNKITVVIRRDTGAIEITPELIEEALNFYFGTDASVTVFYAAQQGVQRMGQLSSLLEGEYKVDWISDDVVYLSPRR